MRVRLVLLCYEIKRECVTTEKFMASIAGVNIQNRSEFHTPIILFSAQHTSHTFLGPCLEQKKYIDLFLEFVHLFASQIHILQRVLEAVYVCMYTIPMR